MRLGRLGNLVRGEDVWSSGEAVRKQFRAVAKQSRGSESTRKYAEFLLRVREIVEKTIWLGWGEQRGSAQTRLEAVLRLILEHIF